MPVRNKRLALGVMAISLAVALAGCAPSTQTTSATSNQPVVVGSSSGIPQLNPAIRTFSFEDTLFPLLWTGLTKYDQSGAVKADFATSWTSNPAATEWTFKLKPGAKFSDGSALDAQAVVDTFNYYLKPDTATQEANKLSTIKSVTAPDATTVVFQLKAANAVLPGAITGVRIMKMAALSTINKDPVTSGPYKVSAFTPDNTVTLVPNKDYWGPAAQLSEIDFTKTADSTAASTSLRSGDITVLVNLAHSDISTFSSDPSISLVKPKSLSQAVTWELDVSSPPFNNVKARQALAYATDRKAILNTAYYGQGAVSTTNTMLADDNPMHDKTGLIKYNFDLAKAKSLFAEAGVTSGATLTWWSGSAFPEWQAAGQIMQANLKKIGINLVIQANDTTTWSDKFYPAGKKYPGLIISNYQSVPSNPAFSMNFLLGGRCECNWNNSQYDSDFNKAVATIDPKAQLALWNAAEKLENSEVPLIIPVQSAPVAAVQSRLKGAWIEGGGQLHLESAHL
ncbi:MAG: peptide/nickel transport system substrate-binding protein [Actinomycetota bacterium]|jgi:peptide/nickel transport system substrate-binding protein|nr:peptide/nickel transport system substrate-binding protein [Actinomycetota bacterium]